MTIKSDQYRFRVFLSYAHADKPLVEKMVGILESLGLHPIWDIDITPGKPFTDEIKELITRSHLFIPVITENSQNRPWVHQETGFAIALNIPILPITVGSLPSEMISTIQAVSVNPDLGDLVDKLSNINLEQIVVPSPQKPYGTIKIAEWPEQRPEYVAQYANWVLEMGEYGVVRAQGRFTVFSVPLAEISDPIWDKREGKAARSPHMRHLQQEERKILERHARVAGCKLIVDPTASTMEEQGSESKRVRLRVFLDFIYSMPHDKLQIVFSERAQESSLEFVGDFFMVEGVAYRRSGYIQTIINSHPPTVLRRIRQFDRLFDEIQNEKPMALDEVIETIEHLVMQES